MEEDSKWYSRVHLTSHQAQHHSNHPQSVVSVHPQRLTANTHVVVFNKRAHRYPFAPHSLLPEKCCVTHLSTIQTTKQRTNDTVENKRKKELIRIYFYVQNQEICPNTRQPENSSTHIIYELIYFPLPFLFIQVYMFPSGKINIPFLRNVNMQKCPLNNLVEHYFPEPRQYQNLGKNPGHSQHMLC